MLNNIIGATAPARDKTISETKSSKRFKSEMSNRERKISEIGIIWNNSKQMRKHNKSFERRATKKLERLTKKLQGLGNRVKEEISNGKKFHQEIVEANLQATNEMANKKRNRQ